jgi:TolA-binding protein
LQTGNKEEALKTFKTVAEKYPQSEPAQVTFFQRASVHHSDNQFDQVRAVMRELIAAYPESERLFQAYDYLAQIETAEKKTQEAIGVYQEFIDKNPDAPAAASAFVKISNLWKAYAEAQGRI